MLFAVHIFDFIGAHDLSYSLSIFLFYMCSQAAAISKNGFALTGRIYFDAAYTQGGALGCWN